MRKVVLWCAVTLLVAVISGCGGNDATQPTSSPGVSAFTVSAQQSGQPVITSPDGATITLEALERIAASSAANHSSLSFSTASNQTAGEVQPSYWCGKYFWDIRWEWGYVGGCIKRNCWHLNLHVRDSQANRDLVNFHLCGWWQNGPQFGLYDPPSNYCATTRGTFTNIASAITDALRRLAPVIPYATAAVIGYVTAGVVVGAFAF